VVQVIYLLANGLTIIDESSPLYTDFELFYNSVTNLIVYIIGVVTLVILLWAFIKEDWQNTKRDFWRVILFGVAGWGFIMFGALIGTQLEYLLRVLVGLNPNYIPGNQEQIELLLQSKYFWVMAVAVLFGAPVLEELVFRKSIFGFCKKFLRLHPIVIIVISGLLFGSIHVLTSIIAGLLTHAGSAAILNELISLISYSFMGMALGATYVLGRENIFTSFIAHFIQNSLSVLIQILFMIFPELLELLNQ
jgi:membrane protease YdiL (CAAX protease family)